MWTHNALSCRAYTMCSKAVAADPIWEPGNVPLVPTPSYLLGDAGTHYA